MKSKIVRLSDRQIEWVKADAKAKETSFSEMLRRILDEWYGQAGRPTRQPTETKTKE